MLREVFTLQEAGIIWSGTTIYFRIILNMDPVISSPPISISYMWKCLIRNRVKHCLWHLWTDSLLTKCNLNWRGVTIDNVCAVCGAQRETMVHVFRDCDFVVHVWNIINSSSIMHCFSTNSPCYWINASLSLSRELFGLFAVTISNIWFNWNRWSMVYLL